MNHENLINSLIQDGYLKTPSIIKAFQVIDRANFVPSEYKKNAYFNAPLPIGFKQTISQPLTVAFMIELLQPKPEEKILEIGSGSGWQAALLAQIISEGSGKSQNRASSLRGKIITIERIQKLKEMTEKNITKYNFIDKGIVEIIGGDGSKGYKKEAPYDKIIAGAAADEIPNEWRKQLKIGGRIVAPIKQSIFVIDKTDKNNFSQKEYFGFSFVPLIIE